jgi:hypothetical protein
MQKKFKDSGVCLIGQNDSWKSKSVPDFGGIA